MPETGGHRRLPDWLLDRSPTRRTSPEGLGTPGSRPVQLAGISAPLSDVPRPAGREILETLAAYCQRIAGPGR